MSIYRQSVQDYIRVCEALLNTDELQMDEFAAGRLLDWNGRGEGIWTFGKHVPSASDNADLKNHGSHIQFVSGHHFFN